MTNHISTGYVLELFGLKRQTLDDWIREGSLTEPERDNRGWRIWTTDSLLEIRKLADKAAAEKARLNSDMDTSFGISARRYLGSKYKLIEFINNAVRENIPHFSSFFEPFAGTGVVSDFYNNLGKTVIVNDILKANYVAYDAFFSSGAYDIAKIRSLIHDLNRIRARTDNYFSANYGGRYFTHGNARMIGAIRDRIDSLQKRGQINEREKNILLTSLFYAADRVANTCGHYDAYRSNLDTTRRLVLLVPRINDAENRDNLVFCGDANSLARRVEADVTYIDTPYNSRQYGDAYHLLENLVDNSKPALVGKARKAPDRKEIKSLYCTGKAIDSFRDLVENLNTRHILVSYNNMAQKGDKRSNAKISGEEILEILSARGPVKVFETCYNAFTAGKTSIHGHKEIIYCCDCSQAQSARQG